MRKSLSLAVAVGAAGVLASTAAHAATVGTWVAAGTANWSASASWQGGVIPNGQGDSALYPTGSSVVTIQDIPAGVRIGTIKATTTSNASWQFTPNFDIILDQDGPGPLSASIINDIQGVTTGNPSIFLNAPQTATPAFTGRFILNDDLLISSTSNSTRSNGAIQVKGIIAGNGNIRYENISNNPAAGQIALTNGGQYGGNTTLAKGALTFTRGDAFTPSPGNSVIIGSAGGGDATLLAIGNGVTGNENQWVAAAGSGGKLIFGAGTGAGAVTIKASSRTSAFTLNGDLNFSNPNTGNTLTIGDPINGAGKLIKIDGGPMRMTDSNAYAGGTLVQGGSLAIGHADAFNNGFGNYPATDGSFGTGDVTVASTAVRAEIEAGLAAINTISDIATVSLAGGGAAGSADNGYMLLGAGVNETVGALMLGGAFQPIGTYGSTASSATFKNDEFFSGPGVLNVTLAPEPTSLALVGIGALGLFARRRRM